MYVNVGADRAIKTASSIPQRFARQLFYVIVLHKYTDTWRGRDVSLKFRVSIPVQILLFII